MPTDLEAIGAKKDENGFRLTGRHVFIILCCFFGTVFAMNFTLARLAITTFRGQVTDHPYEAGLKFNNDIAAARAQSERGWKVDGEFAPLTDGQAQLAFQIRDKAGAPVSGLEMRAVLEAPADRKRDRILTVIESTPGNYIARGPAERGAWNFVLIGRRDGETLYQSHNRVFFN